MDQENQFALIEGLNRADIPWNPSINKEKCINCGICESFCKHGVYSAQNGLVEVMRPMECIVLCNNCEKQCPNQAISFPERINFLKQLRDLRKKNYHQH